MSPFRKEEDYRTRMAAFPRHICSGTKVFVSIMKQRYRYTAWDNLIGRFFPSSSSTAVPG